MKVYVVCRDAFYKGNIVRDTTITGVALTVEGAHAEMRDAMNEMAEEMGARVIRWDKNSTDMPFVGYHQLQFGYDKENLIVIDDGDRYCVYHVETREVYGLPFLDLEVLEEGVSVLFCKPSNKDTTIRVDSYTTDEGVVSDIFPGKASESAGGGWVMWDEAEEDTE